MCGQHSNICIPVQKWGKTPSFKCLVRPFLHWLMQNKVSLELQLVKSKDCLADTPSRAPIDKGDYTLDSVLFHHLTNLMSPFVQPDIDMFATPSNKKFHKFVSRQTHWGAFLVDSLKAPLHQIHHCYANPPWKIISQWLLRLKKNPHIVCLFLCPYWASMSWWPLLIKLAHPIAPQRTINPFQGMFTNCLGKLMPPPRWPLACTVLSGAFYRGNKCQKQQYWLTWGT